MKTNTDSFFHQGTTHAVCQDYAMHGGNFAIVSDGCSSVLDSDIGARIIAKVSQCKMPFLQETPPERSIDLFLGCLSQGTQEAAKAMSLENENSLSATLVTAYQREEEIRTLMFGDGVYGGKKKDGNWEIYVYEFLSGAPYYPYYHFAKKQGEYTTQFGNRYRQTFYYGPIMEEMSVAVSEFNFDFSLPYFWRVFPLKDFEFVFIGTDGLSSFYKTVKTETSKHNAPVPVLDVLRIMLDVNHNQKGFFRLQRNWAFKRKAKGTFLEREWHNADDVSVAGISCHE